MLLWSCLEFFHIFLIDLLLLTLFLNIFTFPVRILTLIFLDILHIFFNHTLYTANLAQIVVDCFLFYCVYWRFVVEDLTRITLVLHWVLLGFFVYFLLEILFVLILCLEFLWFVWKLLWFIIVGFDLWCYFWLIFVVYFVEYVFFF